MAYERVKPIYVKSVHVLFCFVVVVVVVVVVVEVVVVVVVLVLLLCFVTCVIFIAIRRIESSDVFTCNVNLFQQKFIFAVGQRDVSTARFRGNCL